MVAHICAPPRNTNMSTGNNANIWFQYRHKFDQLFTASEQIIPLNTSSDTFTIQRACFHCDGLLGRHINVTRSKLGKLERAIFSKLL